MGLFDTLRKKSDNTNLDNASIMGTAPPSYTTSSGGGSNPSRFINRFSNSNSTQPTLYEPFKFQGQPFAESVTFDTPLYEHWKDKTVANRYKDKSTQTGKDVKVTLSVPKINHTNTPSTTTGEGSASTSTAPTKEPTLDMFVHLECTPDQFSEITIEAIYAPFIRPSEKPDVSATAEAPKNPWVITAILAGLPSQTSTELLATGRFTDTGTWTIKATKGTTTTYTTGQQWTLSGNPIALCASSAYFGPCTVTFRIGVKHAKYSSGKVIDRVDVRDKTHWKTLNRSILFEGQDLDLVKPYMHAVTTRKLLQ